MKKIAIDFFSFLKKPADQKYVDQRLLFKIKILFSLLLFSLILDVIILILQNYLGDIFYIDLTFKTSTSDKNLLLTFILAALIAPILEESVFRLPLKFKSLNLWISFSLLAAIFLKISYKINLFLFISLAIIVLSLITFFILDRKRVFKRLENFWCKKFWFVFYFSSIFFGFLHFTNYQFDYRNLPLIFIIVLPQTISGIFNGYLRVKFGFIWSVFLHFLNNSLLFIPFLFVFIISGTAPTYNPVHQKEYIAIDVTKICESSPIKEIDAINAHRTFVIHTTDQLDFYSDCYRDTNLLVSAKAKSLFYSIIGAKSINDELIIDTAEIGFITKDTLYKVYYFIDTKQTYKFGQNKCGPGSYEESYFWWVDNDLEKYNFIKVEDNWQTLLLIPNKKEFSNTELKGFILAEPWKEKK
jgi:membrane protease YdiL (CAAX protease family)